MWAILKCRTSETQIPLQIHVYMYVCTLLWLCCSTMVRITWEFAKVINLKLVSLCFVYYGGFQSSTNFHATCTLVSWVVLKRTCNSKFRPPWVLTWDIIPYICMEAAILTPWNSVYGCLPRSGCLPGTLHAVCTHMVCTHVVCVWWLYPQTINKTTAKSNVESVSRAYMNAKRSAQEYENLSRGLNRGGTSIPLRGTPQEIQQVSLCWCMWSWYCE